MWSALEFSSASRTAWSGPIITHGFDVATGAKIWAPIGLYGAAALAGDTTGDISVSIMLDALMGVDSGVTRSDPFSESRCVGFAQLAW